MSLARMIANLKRRKGGKFVLHTAEQRYATCEDFLKTIPNAECSGFTEHALETVIPLLTWVCKHDMAYEEPALHSQFAQDIVADFVEQTSSSTTQYFINVTPGEEAHRQMPFGEWMQIFGATFEFAVVALFPNGSLLLVIQDED